MDAHTTLGFPAWIRLTHFFNFLFVTLLMRSGIEIIGAHPKFYWNDDSRPGSEWLRFTRKRLPAGEPWTSEDEIEPLSPWLALPGRNHLGLGRHWHFWSTAGWLATGSLYVVLLVTTSEWHRLVPTSPDFVAEAWRTFLIYFRFGVPAEGHPYNPLQQIAYFGVVFVLTPLQIVTGIAMAPAISGRFPPPTHRFGGRQTMRSLHLLGLFAFGLFLVAHVTLVTAHGLVAGFRRIALDDAGAPASVALLVGVTGVAAVAAFHVVATRATLANPRRARRLLEIGIGPIRRALFHHLGSQQRHEHVSPFARVNGRPPRNERYEQARSEGFTSWRLEVRGLVERPLCLSLDDVRAMPRTTQTTLHVCIQGWTYVATWTGVRVAEILAACSPKPTARFAVFHTMDEKWEAPGHGAYYEVIDLETARREQTILAYEMNGSALSVEHGAPLRLRVENQLGYKMAKWVVGVELVDDFRSVGAGNGGWRDDVLEYYPTDAGI